MILLHINVEKIIARTGRSRKCGAGSAPNAAEAGTENLWGKVIETEKRRKPTGGGNRTLIQNLDTK